MRDSERSASHIETITSDKNECSSVIIAARFQTYFADRSVVADNAFTRRLDFRRVEGNPFPKGFNRYGCGFCLFAEHYRFDIVNVGLRNSDFFHVSRRFFRQRISAVRFERIQKRWKPVWRIFFRISLTVNGKRSHFIIFYKRSLVHSAQGVHEKRYRTRSVRAARAMHIDGIPALVRKRGKHLLVSVFVCPESI